MNEETPSEVGLKRRGLVNSVIWILIAVMFALTAVWAYWASRQPKLHGLFTPDDE